MRCSMTTKARRRYTVFSEPVPRHFPSLSKALVLLSALPTLSRASHVSEACSVAKGPNAVELAVQGHAMLQAFSPKAHRTITTVTEDLMANQKNVKTSDKEKHSFTTLAKSSAIRGTGVSPNKAPGKIEQLEASYSGTAEQSLFDVVQTDDQSNKAKDDVTLQVSFVARFRSVLVTQQYVAYDLLVLAFASLVLGVAAFAAMRSDEVLPCIRKGFAKPCGEITEISKQAATAPPQQTIAVSREDQPNRTVTAANAASKDSEFCPDLVVPQGCECILIVPSKPTRGAPCCITDASGNVVLRISDVDASDDQPGISRKALVDAENEILALVGGCVRRPTDDVKRQNFELMRENGETWAQLTYEPVPNSEDKCTIQSKNGQQFYLVGSIRHNVLNMIDAQGSLIATTEPILQVERGQTPGETYRLRVAPLVDVGMVLCSLICTQHFSL